MNWKPTAIAAVIVIVAGLVAGAAIGGKTSTVVRERGPAQAGSPSQTTVAPTSTPTPAATPSPEGTSSPGQPDADALYVAPPVVAGEGVEEIRLDAEAQLQQGDELSNSMTFDLITEFDGRTREFWHVELQVRGDRPMFKATAGFAQGMPSSNSVEVVLLEDDLKGDELGRESLTGTGRYDIEVPVRTDLAKVIVKLIPGEEEWTPAPDREGLTFVLGEARFE
ncbi:MAG: hypothetical protein ACRDT1_15435 [Micromonosporaceae bacterium]